MSYTLIDSKWETSGTSVDWITYYISQDFIASQDYTLRRVALRGSCPAGTLKLSIRTASGGVPTGSDLISKTLTAPGGDPVFDFDAPGLDLVSGQQYVIILKASVSWIWMVTAGGVGADGVAYYSVNGTDWIPNTLVANPYNFQTYLLDVVPTVTTQPVTAIATTTATGNGNITSLGIPNPTAHGVCWNTGGAPTTADSKTDEGAASAVGTFTADMINLVDGTKYYVKAYTVNAGGTVYGSEVSFTAGGIASIDSIDISEDVQYARYTRGKDEELEQAIAGRIELRLKNTAEKYTPFNTDSDLYGSLLPGKKVAFNYEGQTLFTGSMEKLVPHPRMTQQDAYLLALDGLDFLSRAKISTALYPDYKSGQIINLILDEAGWSSQERVIDDGYTTYPYTVWFLETALQAIQDVTIFEQGFSYIDHRGYFIFEDRNHRLRETRSKVSQYSFDDDDISDITFDYGSARIYNHVEGERINWLVPAVSEEMARLKTENPRIPPEESRTFYLPFSVITDTVSDVTKGTDVNATSGLAGTGSDLNSDLTVTTTAYAKGVKVVFANASIVPMYLTVPGATADGFKVRGEPFTENEAVRVIEEDATSIAAHQIRTYKIPGSYFASVEDLRQICKKVVHYYKDPQALVTVTLKNKDAALLAKMLALLISDRITITSSKLYLTTEDFYINKIEHTIERAGNEHTMGLTLARAFDEEFVILGVSALGINSRLG